jgi:Mg/Co/Ni transporter MgtE
MVELLEFKENTAAGRMNTEYLAVNVSATVRDAIEALRHFEGGVETVSTIYLVDSHGTLAGAVPLAKIVLATPDTAMLSLTLEPLPVPRKKKLRSCSTNTTFRPCLWSTTTRN